MLYMPTLYVKIHVCNLVFLYQLNNLDKNLCETFSNWCSTSELFLFGKRLNFCYFKSLTELQGLQKNNL